MRMRLKNMQSYNRNLWIFGKTHGQRSFHPGWLGYILRDKILPSYIGTIINHYISVFLLTNQYFMECHVRVFFMAFLRAFSAGEGSSTWKNSVFPGYELGQKLGTGAFGTVYCCHARDDVNDGLCLVSLCQLQFANTECPAHARDHGQRCSDLVVRGDRKREPQIYFHHLYRPWMEGVPQPDP